MISAPAAWITVAAGLIACAIAMLSVRLVVRAWRARLIHASQMRMGNAGWRLFDDLSVAIWGVVYAGGVAAVGFGMFVLAW